MAHLDTSDLYERWPFDVEWDNMMDLGWFKWVEGLQSTTSAPSAWMGSFPSSVLEPGALKAIRHDSFICDGGKKEYFEVGWFEVSSKEDLGTGVKAFLDKREARSVALIR